MEESASRSPSEIIPRAPRTLISLNERKERIKRHVLLDYQATTRGRALSPYSSVSKKSEDLENNQRQEQETCSVA